MVHQIDSKNEWLLFSVIFTTKFELVFVLTFGNAFSFHFKANRRSINSSKKKVGLCFIAGCFIKPFQMIINNFFYFSSSFAAKFLLFDIRDIKSENWERQIVRNGELNIYFSNNFNLSAMNVTQLNFLNP